MHTVIVLKEKKLGLVAGIKWAALTDYAGRGRINADMRAKASLSMAEKIVIHSVDSGAGVQSALGMYARNDFEAASISNLHSLAVAFVLAFPNNLHQILAWRIDEKRVAVIVVQNGLPVADEIKNDIDATRLIKDAKAGRMGNSGHIIYTNEPAQFLDGELVDEDVFLKAASKASKLVGIPIRRAYLAAGAVLLAVIAGGGITSYLSYTKEQQVKAAAILAAQDPVPAYQEALAVRISKLGLERKSLKKILNSIGDAEVWNKGWMLEQIECSAGNCISTWQRNGGTTAALLQANPHDEVLSDSTSEKLILRRNVPLLEAGIASREAAVASSVALKNYVNTYQTWRNAGLAVTESEAAKDFVTWPAPPMGDISRLPKELTLQARPISVTVPYPLTGELIDDTPAGVWWESFVLKYSSSDAANALTVTLKGKTYVK